MAWQDRARGAGWVPPEEVNELRAEIERLRAGLVAAHDRLLHYSHGANAQTRVALESIRAGLAAVLDAPPDRTEKRT